MIRIGGKLSRPTILIPTDDLGAILVAEESGTLRQWFIFPDISAGTPRTLANKWMLYTLCRQIGVPCPNTPRPTSLSGVKEFAEPDFSGRCQSSGVAQSEAEGIN